MAKIIRNFIFIYSLKKKETQSISHASCTTPISRTERKVHRERGKERQKDEIHDESSLGSNVHHEDISGGNNPPGRPC